MSSPSMNLDELARKYGGAPASPEPDLDELARKHGAIEAQIEFQVDPRAGLLGTTREVATGFGKSALQHVFNIGGMIRSIPGIGTAIKAVSPDPLEPVSRASGTDRPVMLRYDATGEMFPTTWREAQPMLAKGYSVIDLGMRGTAPESLSMFSEEGQRAIGMVPEGGKQKFGAGLETIAEYVAPGKMISGAGKALAATKIAKSIPWAGRFAAEGLPEAASAMAVAKMQGQKDVGGMGLIAFASPIYGRALNWSGSKLPVALSEKIPEVQLSPRQMLFKALKPINRNLEFDKALTKGIPEIYEQSKLMSKPITDLESLIEVLKATKERIWKPYEEFLGEAKATINGDDIAFAIMQSVKKRAALRHPGAVDSLREYVDRAYAGQRIRIQDAEEYLQNANAELEAYYAKFPRARHVKEEADVGTSATLQEAAALRKAIYGKLDELSQISEAMGGKGIDAAKIKEVYGSLINLQGEAYRRVNVSRRLQPESLTEQMGNVRAAGKFALGIVTKDPLAAAGAFAEAQATRAAAKWIKERNTSDYLVKRAFKDFGKEVEKWRRGQRFLYGGGAVALNTQQKP